MDAICARCRLRLQRAAQTTPHQLTKRAFSRTFLRQRQQGIPVFQPTSQPELDDVLATMRAKHFLPAYLPAYERRLMLGTNQKQTLLDNPQTVTIGDEEITLKWIDCRKDIPGRTQLTHKAIKLLSSGDSRDWQNLPALLGGLKKCESLPEERMMERIVRRAIMAGRLGVILQCLQQSNITGMTLQQEEVLRNVTWGLHFTAQSDNWSAESTAKALGYANQVAQLLESERHGGGARTLSPNDPRAQPELVAVFLELAAMQAHRHQAGIDSDGRVKAFAERLMACIDVSPQPLSHAPPATGPVWEMLQGVPIWHGLQLALILLPGKEMPERLQAEKVVRDYHAGLTILAQAIEAEKPAEGSYHAQALKMWQDCNRD